MIRRSRCGHRLGQGFSEWLATHSCFPEFRCSFPSLYFWRPPGTRDNLKAVVSRLEDCLISTLQNGEVNWVQHRGDSLG